jgi:hypothetical protein
VIYFDTSALIRAFRLGLAPKGISRSHAVAEFYSTLTGRGITVEREGHREQMVLAPKDAASAIKRTFKNVEWFDLKPGQVLEEIPEAVAANVQGPNIHDWLHAGAASLSHATHIATLNEKHFRELSTGIKIMPIAEALKNAPRAV